MDFQMAVSIRIKDLCTKQNINILQLAKNANISYTNLQKIMQNKKKNISISLIQSICNALEIDLKSFFDSELFDLKNLK